MSRLINRRGAAWCDACDMNIMKQPDAKLRSGCFCAKMGGAFTQCGAYFAARKARFAAIVNKP